MRNEIPEVSIIMPCLNEELTIKPCIDKALEWLDKNNISGEIVIGDNGSTDKSKNIAIEAGAIVIDVAHKGYGSACYSAAKASHGKFIIMGDADGSYDFSSLQPFLEKLREGYDLVMGDRFTGGIEQDAMPWKNKYIGNPVLSLIGKIIYRVPINDFHCGLRAFSRDAFTRMDLRTSGMEYASEIVIKSRLHDLKIAEVPTKLHKDGRDRPPHLRPWRDGWRHLKFMMLLSPKWLFWYPGLISFLVGAIVLLWLLPGSYTIGNITFDIHTMFYAGLMILVGFQAMTFGVITRKLGFILGVLPKNKYLARFDEAFSLESGLLLGLFLILSGVLGLIYPLVTWINSGFGELQPAESMRIVIATAVLLITGIQSVLFSLFISFISFITGSRSE